MSILKKKSFFYISKTVHKKLSEPYNRCKNIEDKTYRQSNCIYECVEKIVADRFNCSAGDYFKLKDTLCLNPLNKVNEYKSFCKKECHQECESVHFDYKYSGYLIENTHINIRFSGHTYKEITEIPKINEYAFISSVGGTLGLFFGMRFLSFIEFVEFFIEIFIIIFNSIVKCFRNK